MTSNQTLEGIIEFSKYLFGYNIHRSFKEKRQTIKEREGDLGKRILKLSGNYVFEGLKQFIRYVPLAYESLVIYVSATEDIWALRYLSTSVIIRGTEAMIIGIYKLNKFLPEFKEFTHNLKEFLPEFKEFTHNLKELADPLRRAVSKINFILYKLEQWKDPYEVLEIDKTDNLDIIKKAYRKIAFECHPDKNNGDKEKTQKFKDAAVAYRQLKNKMLDYQPTFTIKRIPLPKPKEFLYQVA